MKNNNLEKKKVFSFDKTFSSDIFFAKPDKYRLLEDLSKDHKKIINSGANLSYSPLGFCEDGVTIDLKKFNRIIKLDSENKTITVEAGITLIDFLNFTLKHSLWIPQLPGYPTITIGGAVASNSHGKSCGIHGAIRKSIKSILLFHKNHGWLNLSENENKEIFDLTVGGLGLTGSIINVTLNLTEIKSTKFITKIRKVSSIKECQNIISKENNSYIYSWHRADNIEKFGEGVVYENQIDNSNQEKFKKLNEYNHNFKPFLFSLWNRYSISLINKIYHFVNVNKKKEETEDFVKVIFPFYGKEKYFNFFGQKGFLESQLLIDNRYLQDFTEEFKKLFKIYKPIITLLSLKNMSGEHKFLRFEGDKVCFTFDYIKSKSSMNFMEEIDKLCLKYKIIPSIIKDSRLNKEIFNKTYVYAEDFKSKLHEFDKQRIYQSEVSNRLGI